jgi:hypothetical protein
MKAFFPLDPPDPSVPLEFEADAELTARIRAGLDAHLAEENDARPLHLRRAARLDAMHRTEGAAA